MIELANVSKHAGEKCILLMVLFATGFVMRNVVKQKPAELLRQ